MRHFLLAALTVAASAHALEPLRYNHPGLTTDLGVGLWAWPLPMDFDGDGDLDLATANEGSNYVSILSNDGNGNFTASPSISVGEEPYSVAAGDVDGDSDIDLAVANEKSHDVSILSNDGTGTFALQAHDPGSKVMYKNIKVKPLE